MPDRHLPRRQPVAPKSMPNCGSELPRRRRSSHRTQPEDAQRHDRVHAAAMPVVQERGEARPPGAGRCAGDTRRRAPSSGDRVVIARWPPPSRSAPSDGTTPRRPPRWDRREARPSCASPRRHSGSIAPAAGRAPGQRRAGKGPGRQIEEALARGHADRPLPEGRDEGRIAVDDDVARPTAYSGRCRAGAPSSGTGTAAARSGSLTRSIVRRRRNPASLGRAGGGDGRAAIGDGGRERRSAGVSRRWTRPVPGRRDRFRWRRRNGPGRDRAARSAQDRCRADGSLRIACSES